MNDSGLFVMEWRQALVLQLIEQYKDIKLLCDATVDDFKNRNKQHFAWAELFYIIQLLLYLIVICSGPWQL